MPWKLNRDIHVLWSANLFLVASSQDPFLRWYGVYCMNKEMTWDPLGASVGSSEDGMHISITGLIGHKLKHTIVLRRTHVLDHAPPSASM